MNKKKVAFHTLGCKVNSYETQAILEQFEAAGFLVVPYDEKADVYVVNTCSVTGEAARKSRQILNRAKKLNPDAVTVATGCYAQEDAGAKLIGADIIVGNNEKSRLIEIVQAVLKDRLALPHVKEESILFDKTIVVTDDLMKCRDYEEQKISNQGSHVRAYVKIQDGCDRFCSYCIIPYLRGRSRSRRPADIIDEVRRLADSGYKEIVVTGIDISDYKYIEDCNPVSETITGSEAGIQKETVDREKSTSADINNDQNNSEINLIRILKQIDKISGIERIRLGSLEEGIITEDFIKEAAGLKHLCPQFHLSLQSGSDSVLKRMNRKYTTEEFAAVTAQLRKNFDRPAITTDIIVGFPGESEEEFEETMAFVEKIRFSAIHVFKYSRRKGTASDRMNGQITDRKKSERAERLSKLASELAIEYRQSFKGERRKVLIEESEVIDGEVWQTGFTPEYFRAGIRTEQDLVNQIVEVVL